MAPFFDSLCSCLSKIEQLLHFFHVEAAAAVAAFGEEYVTELCQILLEGGAPGIHFYTMNQVQPVKRMMEACKASHP